MFNIILISVFYQTIVANLFLENNFLTKEVVFVAGNAGTFLYFLSKTYDSVCLVIENSLSFCAYFTFTFNLIIRLRLLSLVYVDEFLNFLKVKITLYISIDIGICIVATVFIINHVLIERVFENFFITKKVIIHFALMRKKRPGWGYIFVYVFGLLVDRFLVRGNHSRLAKII